MASRGPTWSSRVLWAGGATLLVAIFIKVAINLVLSVIWPVAGFGLGMVVAMAVWRWHRSRDRW